MQAKTHRHSQPVNDCVPHVLSGGKVCVATRQDNGLRDALKFILPNQTLSELFAMALHSCSINWIAQTWFDNTELIWHTVLLNSIAA